MTLMLLWRIIDMNILDTYKQICADSVFALGQAREAHRVANRSAQSGWIELWRELCQELRSIEDKHPSLWREFREIYNNRRV